MPLMFQVFGPLLPLLYCGSGSVFGMHFRIRILCLHVDRPDHYQQTGTCIS